MDLAARIAEKLSAAGIVLDAQQVDTLAGFVRLLVQWNRVYNLTGLRDPDQLIEHHLVESLALRPLLRGQRIADLGTGGGFPGMPLAIAEPDRRFTLIDSRAKRIRFLRHCVGALRLPNVELVQARIETLPAEQPFDTVLARAVAPLPVLLPLARPLTAVGGALVVLTGAGQAPLGPIEGFVAREVERSLTQRVRGEVALLERVEARGRA